jgi:putative inorganic carbon (hco3(-)) transporter
MGFFFTLAYLALSLVRPAELFPALATYRVMAVLAALAAAGTALNLFAGRGPTFRGAQMYLAAAFVAWAGFSVLAAQRWMGGAAHAVADLATNGFLFLLITLNVDDLRRLQLTRRVLVLFALWLVLQGGAAYFFQRGEDLLILHQRVAESVAEGSAEEEEAAPESGVADDAATEPVEPVPVIRRMRSLGFLQDPNDLAQLLAGILPLVFLEWRPQRAVRNGLLVLVPAALLLGGILLTRSRGGLVALAAMAVAAVLHFGNRIVSAFLGVAAGAGLVAGPAYVRSYVLGDESSLGRVEAWYQGLQMLKGSPVWGVGYGNFTEYNDRVAHNSYVHCLAELGVVGYSFWVGMIIVTFHDLRSLYRRPRPDEPPAKDPLQGELRRWATATALALVGFLAGALMLSRTYSPTFFIFLALPTALADVARRAGRLGAPLSPVQWASAVAAAQIVTLAVVYGMVRLVR